jgi:hypothetical protein
MALMDGRRVRRGRCAHRCSSAGRCASLGTACRGGCFRTLVARMSDRPSCARMRSTPRWVRSTSDRVDAAALGVGLADERVAFGAIAPLEGGDSALPLGQLGCHWSHIRAQSHFGRFSSPQRHRSSAAPASAPAPTPTSARTSGTAARGRSGASRRPCWASLAVRCRPGRWPSAAHLPGRCNSSCSRSGSRTSPSRVTPSSS